MNNLLETIINLDNKPANNKILRESWRLLWPYGAMPKKIEELKKEVVHALKKSIENDFYEHAKSREQQFLNYLSEQLGVK